jgi:hypothetical protein
MAKVVNATANIVNSISVIVNCTSKVENSNLRNVNSQSPSFLACFNLFVVCNSSPNAYDPDQNKKSRKIAGFFG